MADVDDIFTFGAQQQCEAYNRIAAYKEKQAAHELLTAQVLHEKAQLALTHTKQILRPSLIVRPSLAKDGDDWIASHGACKGCGLTPDLAFQDFDVNWVGKKNDN